SAGRATASTSAPRRPAAPRESRRSAAAPPALPGVRAARRGSSGCRARTTGAGSDCAHIEAVRVGMDGGVAVGGGDEREDAIPRADPHACDLGRGLREAGEAVGGVVEAEDLLHGRRVQRTIVTKPLELLRMAGEVV